MPRPPDNRTLEALSPADLHVLLETGREVATETALEPLLKMILGAAGRLTDSPDTSVILKHERRPGLYVAAATGSECDWVLATFGQHSDKEIPIEGSKAGRVFESGLTLIENEVSGHFEEVDKETDSVTQSMVCVPLRAGDTVIGVMQVLNRRSGPYSQRDALILDHFAAQAAVAIRNAQLVESLLAHSGLYAKCRDTGELFMRFDELRRDARAETLSVMFADMRGFTQLTQTMFDLALVQRRLSEFVTLLADGVLAHDGIVNKFLGDGVLAFFRGEDHARRAVGAAFELLAQFHALRERWNAESNQQLDFLDLGVGIATDRVILGGIGESSLRDFTAIGVAVNMAAALEKDARDGRRILCDQLTLNMAGDLVGDYDGPEDFVLKKPGQTTGVAFKRYSLKRLGQHRPHQIFISHSQADRELVERRVVGPLRAAGFVTWYAADDIPKGSLWTAEIRKAIADSDWMLVVVSGRAVGSKWVRREIDLAVTAEHLDDRIIPVVVDDTEIAAVNEFLATMQGVVLGDDDEIASVIAARIGNV